MKARRHTPNQVIGKLREAKRMLGEGRSTAEAVKTLEVSEVTSPPLALPVRGVKAKDAKRLRELEKENAPLKRIVTDRELE